MSTQPQNTPKVKKPKFQPGEMIPLYESQREFLELRGKIVDNPEMEMILYLDNEPSERMPFPGQPLPHEAPMTPKMLEDLNTALAKQFTCHTKGCENEGKPSTCKYEIVYFKKELPHFEMTDQRLAHALNEIAIRRFGKRMQTSICVAVKCLKCGKIVQFVKYNKTNRRAAKDTTINGPHQIRK